MKKTKVEERDPAWNRNRTKRKSQKMCSRGSLKVLRSLIRKKREADKTKEKHVCATRTVEFPSTQLREERNKLLYMLAIGLFPSPESVKKNAQLPFVKIQRMDTLFEAQAQTKTTERIFEIVARRQMEARRRQYMMFSQRSRQENCSQNGVAHQAQRKKPNRAKEVEIVDLVSDDDSCCSVVEDSYDDEPVMIQESYRPSGLPSHKTQTFVNNPSSNSNCQSNNNHSWFSSEESSSYEIHPCSKLGPRQSVFKPIVNNQDRGIFRNWKPESVSGLSFTKSNPSNPSPPVSKFLSSLKSLPLNSPNSSSSSNICAGGCSGDVRKKKSSFEDSDGVITLD